MSKIDYSQFYLKNYRPEKNINKKTSKPVDYKPKSSKKGLILLICVILIISILVYANFMMDDLTLESFKSWFKKEKNSDYFLLVKKFDDRDQAYAQSLLIRQSGAAGYIFKENEKYIVVYTTFLEKQDAEEVAKKNLSTEIIERNFGEKNDFYDTIDSALNEVIVACEQLENGDIYEARLLETTSIIKNQLTEQKSNYINDSNYAKYVNILDLFIGGLSSLNFPSPTRVSLLSDLRYIISSVIISCCEE